MRRNMTSALQKKIEWLDISVSHESLWMILVRIQGLPEKKKYEQFNG